MAITVTQIANSQTFGAWLATTNRLANIVSQNTVTTDSTSGGSLTTGNGFVNGFFGANYIYVNTGLVGGNVSTNGQINVLSNTVFQYSATNLLSITGNTTACTIVAAVNTFTITTNTLTTTANTIGFTGVITMANTLAVTGNVTANSFLGNGNFLTTVNATNITTGTLPNARLAAEVVNTSGTFTITGIRTMQANLHMGNTTVNTQISNATIQISNTASVTTLGLADLRIGNTVTNVVIANTTSNFGGNVVIVGTANVAANLVVGSSGELVISNGAGIEANGTLGSAGQVLASNGTGVYWSTTSGAVTSIATGNGVSGGPITTTGTIGIIANNGLLANTSGIFVVANSGIVVNSTGVHVNSALFVNTSGSYTITGVQTYNANLIIGATSELIIANGAGIQANGTFGTAGQILASNGTGVYWAAAGGTGTVTNIATGNGVSGGPITSTGTITIVANNGLLANTSGLFVVPGSGIVVNSTGVHVNSALFTNTSGSYTMTGVQTYNANVVIGASGELLISNGAGIQANGSFGTAGQVLSSNGTGVYWANVAAGGGGGSFNTNISNSVGFAANSTMSAAYTAPGTAGLRYIIHSIHITNIGGANTGISGEFEGTTYTNISFATTVPVPADSAVELLKAPKVMQPSDILKLRVDDNTALHATITLETQSTTNLFGAGVDVTADATYTDLLTAQFNAVLQSVLLSNDDGVNDVRARVVWTDNSNNIQGYYCFDLIIPADSTVEILEQPKFLAEGNKVRVYANVGGRLEAIVAGRYI